MRKILIVIEETGEGEGMGFNVHLAGDKERIGKVPDSELGPAEFWGSNLFHVCVQVLQQAGVIRDVHPVPKNDSNNPGSKLC
jgi:hypothetical protein